MPALQQDFHVHSVAVFGSVARNEAKRNSDIDILVEFERPPGLVQFMRLKFLLEERLGKSVDLVTPKALKPTMKTQILKEAIRIA